LIKSEYKIYSEPFLWLLHDMSIDFTFKVKSLYL